MNCFTSILISIGLLPLRPRYPRTRDPLPFLSSPRTCRHLIIIGGVCKDCGWKTAGATGDHHNSLGSNHTLMRDLRIEKNRFSRLKDLNSVALFAKKKLHLVLDLDLTLLHAKQFAHLTSQESRLKSEAIFVPGFSNPFSTIDITTSDLFMLETEYLVKLRPFVRTFLKEANSMFEIWICTKGTRHYGEQIMKILDSSNKYLSRMRLITREVLGERKKSLDLVLARESCTIIIDDNIDVWDINNFQNLIEIPRYFYFETSYNKKLPFFEKKSDESENDGALSNILRVLKQIHGLVFSDDDVARFCDGISSRDVRVLMKKIRQEILMGCKLFIREDGDYKTSYRRIKVWETALSMGCKFSAVLDSSVTHLVVLSNSNSDTKNKEWFYWAEKEKKFVINPNWVFDAYYLWKKQPEENYLPSMSSSSSTLSCSSP